MVDSYLASDNVTVLGGPSIISVDVDFGPTGDRGSSFFVGNGNPNLPSTVIGQTPQLFDMYINVAGAADEDSLYIFQYQNVDGSLYWVKLVKLIPNIYSENNTGSFLDGERSISVPIANIVAPSLVGDVTSANFNVQATILNTSVTASAISLGDIEQDIDDNYILPITIKASEFDGTDWTPLSGSKTIQLLITVV
jgi:hypothetical protein